MIWCEFSTNKRAVANAAKPRESTHFGPRLNGAHDQTFRRMRAAQLEKFPGKRQSAGVAANKEIDRQRFLCVIDLHDSGVAMMRQRLMQRHAGASAEEIDAHLVHWLGSVPDMAANDPDLRPWHPRNRR